MRLASAFAGIVILFTVSAPVLSNAYELDTHFYATYAMARYAGIKHDTAKVIASAAQWPDETEVLGSPMITNLGIGTKMRRLFHFSCDNIVTPNSAENVGTLFGTLVKVGGKLASLSGDRKHFDDYILALNADCEVKPIHLLAFNILLEGLREGNLIKAATAIHTIEDSFAHAGTNSVIGHAALGHTVDRPYTDIGKYHDMVRGVMAALVAIRKNLPSESIDAEYVAPYSLFAGKPNASLTIEELYRSYTANPYFPQSFENTYKNPEMVMRGIKFFLSRAQKNGNDGDFWIDPKFDVLSWLALQPDLQALINSGQTGTCTIPTVRDHQPQPSNIDCVLTYILAKLMLVKLDSDTYVVDRYKARVLNLDYSTLFPQAEPYNKKIEKLKVEVDDLKGQYSKTLFWLGKNQGSERLAKLSEEIKTRQLEITSTRLQRRRVTGENFSQLLRDEVKLGHTNSLHMTLQIVTHETAGYLPKIINGEHQFEFENEGDLRTFELALRVRSVRDMISKMFDHVEPGNPRATHPEYVRFIENDKTWSYPLSRHKIQNLPLNQASVLPLTHEIEFKNNHKVPSNIDYVTFNYTQIDIWVETMLRYMFPLMTDKMFPKNKCSIIGDIPRLDANALPVKNKDGEIEMFRSVVSVKGRNQVALSFVNLILNPDFTDCNLGQQKNALIRNMKDVFPLYGAYSGTRAFVNRFKEYLNDFRTTHLKPIPELNFFNDDRGIDYIFSTFHPKQFLYWAEATREQKRILDNDMYRRSLLEKDDTPYSIDGDGKIAH